MKKSWLSMADGHPDAALADLFPGHSKARVFVSHPWRELLVGVLRRLGTSRDLTWYLGFNNRGGTLDIFGMLFANRCTWAHVLVTAAQAMGVPAASSLTEAELAAMGDEATRKCFATCQRPFDWKVERYNE
ncbi:hypothetical protein [Rhodoferax sp.]|uniref:hypothetical protein n=1 Tax=Rhodoferax sp. TaxID=50421 RepID=UPI001ED140EB|nr:hypothetical protein [Rhodoferax sp.]MBT9508654.1 hypothetical protein [Rhodoferax sp.]